MSINFHLGHGMGGELEKKDWDDLEPSNVKVLQAYYKELNGSIKITWQSPRPFSSAILLDVDNQSFFIKRSHISFRSVNDLKDEHKIIAALNMQHISVPDVLKTLSGETAIQIDDWVYEVHKKSEDLDLYAEQLSWKPFFSTSHARSAGVALGQLHNASKHYKNNTPRQTKYLISNQQLLESPNIIEAIQNKIKRSVGLHQYFKDNPLNEDVLKQIAYFHSQIRDSLNQQPKIWTHNDFHASNLLWKKDLTDTYVGTIIDFGLSNLNCAAYDVATAIERNFIDWLAIYESQKIQIDWAGIRTFIQGYCSNIETLEPLHLVPELLRVVHLDFALSELEYFIEITGNLKHADAAYCDWFVGHTQWFSQEQGQKFIHDLTLLIKEEVQRYVK